MPLTFFNDTTLVIKKEIAPFNVYISSNTDQKTMVADLLSVEKGMLDEEIARITNSYTSHMEKTEKNNWIAENQKYICCQALLANYFGLQIKIEGSDLTSRYLAIFHASKVNLHWKDPKLSTERKLAKWLTLYCYITDCLADTGTKQKLIDARLLIDDKNAEQILKSNIAMIGAALAYEYSISNLAFFNNVGIAGTAASIMTLLVLVGIVAFMATPLSFTVGLVGIAALIMGMLSIQTWFITNKEHGKTDSNYNDKYQSWQLGVEQPKDKSASKSGVLDGIKSGVKNVVGKATNAVADKILDKNTLDYALMSKLQEMLNLTLEIEPLALRK